MHTARQLDAALFSVRHHGKPATREDLLPGWTPLDRLGVVMTEPFGAIGASHLIQLAITAFYDAKPMRRAGRVDDVDPRSVYPEIYLFHVGGAYGYHGAFDFAPPHRKEVFVEAHASLVLDAINDRGITRLAVPDGRVTPADHVHKEPSAALDRIAGAFAYSPTAQVRDADWTIEGTDARTEANVRMVLEPDRRARLGTGELVPFDDPILESRRWQNVKRQRLDEAGSALPLAQRRREAVRNAQGLARERYRAIAVEDALGMLA